MRKDAMKFSKRCDACQRHAHVSHQLAEPLHQVISPWPIMKWGMDIVGPLPRAPGNKVYMLAMTDYFSKWKEAELSSQVTEIQKLEEIGGKWAEELPLVLWADRTTPKVATGQTPFSLVEMASSLDMIDELRTSAQIRMASYRQIVARSYNKNVKVRTLQVGDLVMRKVFQNTKNQQAGKFAYN
ncbi:uncharacterized protein LOC141641746 [Silene latifolia]|uniref:uncharacterized protein LOC141641746 n=1 Tax=Silene latifolia TaxID=37657 RepID=UPI003D78B070